MNDIVWLPSLLVLGIGLAIGLVAGAVVRRNRKRKPDQPKKPGDALRLRDLEARREELYRRLRSADLNAGDRQSLELAAAHTLRELDRLAPGRSAKKRQAAEAPAPAAPESAPLPIGGRHPALVGFLAGMAVVLLVGTLVYLAVRDSGAGSATAPTAAAGSPDMPHPDSEALPADLQRELEQLEAAAAAAPDDLLALKRLALGRLDAGLYFESFADAEKILAARPEDPDGLFIQGVVRLSMGRAAEALDLLDRVLVRYPEHLQAMIYRGIALAQGGEVEQAISTWEMALDMAGGSHPDLELLIQQAQTRQQQPAATTAPVAPVAPAETPASPPPASAPPLASAPPPAAMPQAADAYNITIELAAGHTVAPTTVLFVFLRPGETGPPVAVKRIPAPRFPLDLTLGAADAMMGAALPDQGTLVARLSTSGSANASGPEDLEAASAAQVGQSTRLVLGGS